MIELETMLMQFCLETSGRRNGDRYPVGKGCPSLLLFVDVNADGLIGRVGWRSGLPTAESFCGRGGRHSLGR